MSQEMEKGFVTLIPRVLIAIHCRIFDEDGRTSGRKDSIIDLELRWLEGLDHSKEHDRTRDEGSPKSWKKVPLNLLRVCSEPATPRDKNLASNYTLCSMFSRI
ncbi:hypothetical protein U1Q18_004117 [Sarracenia purpurea var. burkii]